MINFCNLQWTTTMEGGRLIHTGQPWMWYDDDAVYVDDNNNVELTVYKDPTTITYEGNEEDKSCIEKYIQKLGE